MANFQFISFYVGENLFGLNIIHIREIIRRFDITPVEGASEFVLGVLNLRGQIVTVLDPGIKFAIGKRTITPNSRCIVLKTTQELRKNRDDGFLEENTSNDWIGLVVDSMGDVITVPEEEISPPPANLSGLDSKFLAGVVNRNSELLVLLKISEVVGS
ncbi:MAG: CheW2 [uncultured bacterium]|nr:MAG: CheW2 [uncultured bacterium]